MATLQRAGHHRQKPWRARVRVDGARYFLGYFKTKEEAEQQEKEYREYYRTSDRKLA